MPTIMSHEALASIARESLANIKKDFGADEAKGTPAVSIPTLNPFSMSLWLEEQKGILLQTVGVTPAAKKQRQVAGSAGSTGAASSADVVIPEELGTLGEYVHEDRVQGLLNELTDYRAQVAAKMHQLLEDNPGSIQPLIISGSGFMRRAPWRTSRTLPRGASSARSMLHDLG